MKYDFVNQDEYFREEINEHFPETLLDELDIRVLVHSDHENDKFNVRPITKLFSAVGSTPTTWSSKRQTTVQT